MTATPTILANGVALAAIGQAVESSLAVGAPLALTLASTTGYTSFAWVVLSRPFGSTATLTSETGFSTSITTDKPGRYRIRGSANGGEVRRDVEVIVALTANLGLRKAQGGERLAALVEKYNDSLDTIDGGGVTQIVTPTGDLSADTANVQAAIDAMAGVGEVVLGAGQFELDTITLRDGTRMRGAASRHDTILNFDTTGTELYNSGLYAHGSTPVGSTTVAAVNVVGTKALSLTGLAGGSTTTSGFVQPAIGSTVQVLMTSTAGLVADQRVFVAGGGTYQLVSIADATHATIRNLGWRENVATGATVASGAIVVGAVFQVRSSVTGSYFNGGCYEVKAISGSGPYAVTTERPVKFLFGVGDSVIVVQDQPRDIVIEDFTVTGSASRMCELLCVRGCTMRRLVFRNYTTHKTGGGISDLAVSFDSFSHNCLIEDVDVDAGGTDAGIGVESNDGTRVVRARVTGTPIIGLRVNDGADCEVISPLISDCAGWGIRAMAETTGNGPLRLRIRGGSIVGCGIGIDLQSVVSATLTGVTAHSNTGWNCVVGGTSTARINGGTFTSDAVFTSSYVTSCRSNFGLIVQDTAVLQATGIDTTGCRTGVHVYAGTRAYIDGFRHDGCSGSDGNASQARLVVAGTAVVRHADITMQGGYRAIQVSSGTLRLSHSTIVGTTAFVGAVAIGGALFVEHTTFTGFGAGNDIDASSGVVIFGAGMARNPTVGSGGTTNGGTLTLNGASGVVVSVPAALGLVAGGESRISIAIKTVGGTQGKEPTVVAGTNQFTVTGTASDTSVYAWRVN